MSGHFHHMLVELKNEKMRKEEAGNILVSYADEWSKFLDKLIDGDEYYIVHRPSIKKFYDNKEITIEDLHNIHDITKKCLKLEIEYKLKDAFIHNLLSQNKKMADKLEELTTK